MSHTRAFILLFAGFLGGAPAWADPPPWAGGGKKHGKDHDRGSERHRDYDHEGRHFSDRHRIVIREYYGGQFRGGKCPPGLAKKHNGCMPPGHARKWHVGQPLPRDVVYYRVPPALVVKLPAPRAGERYVRVAADILLIAAGTGMVIDAVRDLGAM